MKFVNVFDWIWYIKLYLLTFFGQMSKNRKYSFVFNTLVIIVVMQSNCWDTWYMFDLKLITNLIPTSKLTNGVYERISASFLHGSQAVCFLLACLFSLCSLNPLPCTNQYNPTSNALHSILVFLNILLRTD